MKGGECIHSCDCAYSQGRDGPTNPLSSYQVYSVITDAFFHFNNSKKSLVNMTQDYGQRLRFIGIEKSPPRDVIQ